MSELPDGWKWSTLGEVGRYLNGRGFKKTEWAETGRPIIRIQNLTGSTGVTNYFRGQADERHVVRRGDLLVSWAATLGVFVWDGPEAVLNQHIFKVESHVDSGYRRYLLENVLADLRRQAHGSGMVHITKSKFDETPVPVPPLAEQRRIVAAIDEYFSRLDAAEASLAHARALQPVLRDSIWQMAFDKADWPVEKLEDLNDPERPIRYGILKPGPDVDGGVPYVKVRDYPDGLIDVHALKRTTLEIAHQYRRATLEDGDLLISIRGTHGRLAPVPDALAGGNITQDSARIAPKRIERSYLIQYLRSPQARKYLDSVARGVAVRGVNIGDLRPMPVPVGDPRSRAETVEHLERAEGSLAEVQRELESALRRARAMRSSVLAAAFSGRLVPQDPSDEPASVLLDRIAAERSARNPSRRKKAET